MVERQQMWKEAAAFADGAAKTGGARAATEGNMFSGCLGQRLIAAGIGLFLSLVSVVSHAAGADDHGRPEFLFGVRMGDKAASILSQQGWYACDNGTIKAACFDEVTLYGRVGKFQIHMLNGKAYFAEFFPQRSKGYWETLKAVRASGNGAPTVVELKTKNTNIDMIKAIHDLGSTEAGKRFSGYLLDDNPSLWSISFVQLPRPSDAAFPDAAAYEDSLPAGTFEITVGTLMDVTYVRLYPTLASNIAAFPEYCHDNCKSWSQP
jgi:hypothetical protein